MDAGTELGSQSIWPSMYPEILRLVEAHRSTIVFVNNRRLAERLALRLNELAEKEIARAHHGSLAREQRVVVEEDLKAGRIPCLVATSCLELGIDMGAVDLVIQVESPKSVARGLQRIGRAGHELGAVSKGRIFPKFRADLLESAVVARAMRAGEIEETKIPRNPLDVLAQQIVAISADEEIAVDELHELVRRAYPFADLSRAQLENVLDMLAGRYPSDEFAELRPRIVWDRTGGTIRAREGARRLAVTNAGTIPDRGLFGVFLVDGGGRVGELDEEMVYEARAGQTFLLGASTWRIEEITRDRVLVSPAPGLPGAVPFWKGEGVGRPYELGEKIGAASRELSALGDDDRTRPAARRVPPRRARGAQPAHVPARAGGRDRRACRPTARSSSSASATRSATGASASSRRSAAACTRRGRWRSPRGCASRSASRRSRSGRTTGSRCTSPTPTRRRRSPTCCSTRTRSRISSSPSSATRRSSARASARTPRASLLIPRRRPGQRTPLWQQRLKAQSLLQVARRYGSFPIVLETYRECLQDVFDLPALRRLLHGIQTRQLDLVEVETGSASPFSASLLFDYVATYMYEDDTPPAERRAQALSLDRELLRELLGQEELRDLLDRDAVEEVERQLRGEPRSADELHDKLRLRGDLRAGEYDPALAEPLLAERRARARAHRRRGAPDRGRGRRPLPRRARRDAAVGPARRLPRGRAGLAAPARPPLRARAAARSRPPRRTSASAATWPACSRSSSATSCSCAASCAPAAASASGATPTCCAACAARRSRRCAARSSRSSRRRSRASCPRGTGSTGARRCARRSCRCRRWRLPVGSVGGELLPRRVPGYRPEQLDALCASGEVVWVGAGLDRVALYFREDAAVLGQVAGAPRPEGEVHDRIRAALERGAVFWLDLLEETGLADEEALPALWDLVWAGEVTNDAWTPLRAGRRYGVPKPERRPRRFSRSPRERRDGDAGTLVAHRAAVRRRRAERRALAELLLERQGIVTRDGVRAEGIPGGYGAVYAELRALETLGLCRRGYFVEGLGGAQFALGGAVERLRELRDARRGAAPLVLAAADPAQPYGAALPWPKRAGSRAARVAGAYVVLLGGEAALYVERGGTTLVPLRDPDESWLRPALAALVDHVRAARREAPRGRALRRRAGRRDRRDAAPRRGRLPRRPASRRAAAVS